MAITIDKALEISAQCERALRIAGLQADVPYSQAQLCEAIAALVKDRKDLAEAATLSNRRYAAANARYARLAKMTGKHVDEETA